MAIHPDVKKLFETMPHFEGKDQVRLFDQEKVDTVFSYYQPGETHDTHSHDTANCGLILSGVMYLTIEGEERAYEQGEWYYIRAGAAHSSRFIEKTESIEFYFKS